VAGARVRRRWNLSFDGHKGELGIDHIPGISQWLFDKQGEHVADRRIGSFQRGTAVHARRDGR
jgi:hypothetical protein